MSISSNLQNKCSAFVIITASIVVTALFFMDHILEIEFCSLCFIQRPSWYLILITMPFYHLFKKMHFLVLVLSLASLSLLITMGIGIFQAGSEWHLWQGLTSCGNYQQDIKDFFLPNTSLSNPLQLPEYIPCTDNPWRLFGISFAGYNALLSAFLIFILGIMFNNLRNSRG